MWIISDQWSFSKKVHLLLSTLTADPSRQELEHLRNLMNGRDSIHLPPKKLKHCCTCFSPLAIQKSQRPAYSNISQWKSAAHAKFCAFQGWLTKSLICKTHIRGNTSSETCRGMTSEKYYGVAQSESRSLFWYSFIVPSECCMNSSAKPRWLVCSQLCSHFCPLHGEEKLRTVLSFILLFLLLSLLLHMVALQLVVPAFRWRWRYTLYELPVYRLREKQITNRLVHKASSVCLAV